MEETTNVFKENSECADLADENVIVDKYILSAPLAELLQIIFLVYLDCPVSVIGSIANVINIVIFYKQGFSDSVNVGFCALAASDLCSLVPLLWSSICISPLFRNADIGFDSADVSQITAGLPHNCFVRTTSWITALITFERCVCIALPFKVKDIITPKRTFISIATIFVTLAAMLTPFFSSFYFATQFHNETKKSLVKVGYTIDYPMFSYYAFLVNVVAQLSSFIIVIMCTAILVLKLLSQSKWRQKSISVVGTSDSTSVREKRVVKMVTFLSSLFILCYLPTAVNYVMMIHFSSEYSGTGRHKRAYYVSWSIITTIDALNSSTTILIYYNMSSKYRASLIGLFKTVITYITNN